MRLSKLIIIAGGIALALLVFISSSRTRQMEQNLGDDKQHFVSGRVPLSFQYPKNWPVSPAGKEWEDGKYLDDKTLEAIDFSEEFTPNASSDSFGYILVSKINIDDLEAYLREKHDGECTLNLSIEKNNIGNTQGYKVSFENNQKCGGIFGPKPDYTYYVYQDGLLYQMALTNPTYRNGNPEEAKKVFENIILSSMKFE